MRGRGRPAGGGGAELVARRGRRRGHQRPAQRAAHAHGHGQPAGQPARAAVVAGQRVGPQRTPASQSRRPEARQRCGRRACEGIESLERRLRVSRVGALHACHCVAFETWLLDGRRGAEPCELWRESETADGFSFKSAKRNGANNMGSRLGRIWLWVFHLSHTFRYFFFCINREGGHDCSHVAPA